jgi:3',5'-cyclic-AMP phosphodiesterase
MPSMRGAAATRVGGPPKDGGLADCTIVQLSDLHLTVDGTLSPGFRPGDNLRSGLAALAEAHLRPDMFVLTGDLADGGDPACYEELVSVMGEPARTTGAQVVYVPGNHDDRAAMRACLLDEAASDLPINQVHRCGGLRVVSIDSSVPGEEFGALTDETVAFLREVLASSAPQGTVLAVHHPPIPSPIEPMSVIGLRNPGALAEAIAGSDVRLIICGHNHHETMGTLGPVPVWVSPSTAYRADVRNRDVFSKLPGSALSQIIVDDGNATVSVIHVPLPPR